MKHTEMKKLQQNIINWAKAKGIDNPQNQRLKILEETGETAGAILRGNREDILNEIGDIAVTVIIYHWQIQIETKFPHGIERIDWIDTKILEELQMIAEDLDNELNLFSVDFISRHFNSTLEECLTLAWNKIKKRQGKTVNGTFIKD